MKITYLAALPFFFVVLFFATPSVQADSYAGPYCFENPTKFPSATDPQSDTYDPSRIRGTCKNLEFIRIITVDAAITTPYRFTGLSHVPDPQNGFVLYEYMPKNIATTSQSLIVNPGYDLNNIVLALGDGDPEYGGIWGEAGNGYNQPIYLSRIASEDKFAEVELDLPNMEISFVDERGEPSERMFNTYYKSRGGIFVPITSPLKKVVEHWRITKKPSGFMLVKDKTEIYLDDGSMKTSMNSSIAVASTTPLEPTSIASWWSRIADFFKNLF